MHKLALMLRHLDLSLRKHYIFALSPTDPEDPPVAAALLSFASCYASRYTQTLHGCSLVSHSFLTFVCWHAEQRSS